MHVMVSMAKAMSMLRAKKSLFFILLGAASLSATLAAAPAPSKWLSTVTVTDKGAHATMIQHVLPEIIERVNRFFGYGAVARVKVRQGPVAKPPARQPIAPPSLKPIPMELGESLREIGDPELFAVLESLAKSLAKGSE